AILKFQLTGNSSRSRLRLDIGQGYQTKQNKNKSILHRANGYTAPPIRLWANLTEIFQKGLKGRTNLPKRLLSLIQGGINARAGFFPPPGNGCGLRNSGRPVRPQNRPETTGSR